MHLSRLNIRNFRKLKDTTIELNEQQTALIGPNNSGKSSAVEVIRWAMRGIGGEGSGEEGADGADDGSEGSKPRVRLFSDVFGGNWAELTTHLEKLTKLSSSPSTNLADEQSQIVQDINALLPQLDFLIKAKQTELAPLWPLIVQLDPLAEFYGVRVSLTLRHEGGGHGANDFGRGYSEQNIRRDKVAKLTENKDARQALHPRSFLAYFKRHFGSLTQFNVTAFAIKMADDGKPEFIEDKAVSISQRDFSNVIRIRIIDAQQSSGQDKLTDEIRRFAKLNFKVEALEEESHQNWTVSQAETEVNQNVLLGKLLGGTSPYKEEPSVPETSKKEGSRPPFVELREAMNGPGRTGPQLQVMVPAQPDVTVPQHATAGYQTNPDDNPHGQQALDTALSETSLGLGYQHMTRKGLRLLGYRKDWLRPALSNDDVFGMANRRVAPILLVVLEEPETNIHPPAQAVFVKAAYELLDPEREGINTAELGFKPHHQMIFTTHSPHLVEALDLSNTRYFRSDEMGEDNKPIAFPHSNVIAPMAPRAKETPLTEEERVLQLRYLQRHHNDLFFADAVILVEGRAEEILVRHFMDRVPELKRAFVSIVSVGGTSAHLYFELLGDMGRPFLVIADIDPKKGDPDESTNPVLPDYFGQNHSVTVLRSFSAKKLEKTFGGAPSRIAFQQTESIDNDETKPFEARSFEDALVVRNWTLFKDATNQGAPLSTLANKLKALKSSDTEEIQEEIFKAVVSKGRFAAKLTVNSYFSESLKPPSYIEKGLDWLAAELAKRDPLRPGQERPKQEPET